MVTDVTFRCASIITYLPDSFNYDTPTKRVTWYCKCGSVAVVVFEQAAPIDRVTCEVCNRDYDAVADPQRPDYVLLKERRWSV